jgi:hypothetical protein
MKDLQGFLVTSLLGAFIGYKVNESLQKARQKQEIKVVEDALIKPKVDPEFLYFEHDNVQL